MEQSEEHDRALVEGEVVAQPDRGRVLSIISPHDPYPSCRAAGQERLAVEDGKVVRPSPPPHGPWSSRRGELDGLTAPAGDDPGQFALTSDRRDDLAAPLLQLGEDSAIGICQQSGGPAGVTVRLDMADATLIDQPQPTRRPVSLARPGVGDHDRRISQRLADGSSSVDQRSVQASDGVVDQLDAGHRQRWSRVRRVISTNSLPYVRTSLRASVALMSGLANAPTGSGRPGPTARTLPAQRSPCRAAASPSSSWLLPGSRPSGAAVR
jgi:hypothetical protein